MGDIMNIFNLKLFVYGLISISIVASSPSTSMKIAQANTCSSDTRPTFLKDIPSLAWYTFDNVAFESIESVKSEILGNPKYYRIINGTIDQITSTTNFQSLDGTNLSTFQTLYIFEVPNEQFGYISRNQSLINSEIDTYIEETVNSSIRYIENDYEQLFFSESPVNKEFYFAYSNQFNMSFYGGCYVSATTTNPTFNFESTVQLNALPSYPLENGYLYNVVIKSSSIGVVLDQYSVFVRTSLIPPSFNINQTNLLSLVNNDQTPKLSFTENISLTYSLPVPEALIVIVNLNNFNDEGRFIHLTTSGNQSTLSGTIDLPENQHFELTLFYLDYSKESPITKRKYEIYTSEVNFLNSLFSIDLTNSAYLTNPNYQRSVFDYYLDNHQREFTLWVNQKPDQSLKHEGFLLRSFSIQRQNLPLLEDDFGKLITNESNAYRFIKNGTYSISYRYNNKPTAQVTQSINFSSLNQTKLNLLNAENEEIKTLLPQGSGNSVNFINTTNLVLSLSYDGLNESRTIPVNLTISNDLGETRSITSSSTKNISLNSELQLLKPLDQGFFNYTISLVDPNASFTYVYAIEYRSIFECIKFSQSYDANSQDPLNQFKDIASINRRSLTDNLNLPLNEQSECNINKSPIDATLSLESSPYLYLLVSSDIVSIQSQEKGKDIQTIYTKPSDQPVENMKVHQIELPDGQTIQNQVEMTIILKDKYENTFTLRFLLKPQVGNLSIFNLSPLLLLISILAVVLSSLILIVKKK